MLLYSNGVHTGIQLHTHEVSRCIMHMYMYLCIAEHSTQDYVGFPFFHIHAFKITIPRVHQQTGGADCGLFAIANAVELAEGGCPRNVTYNQERMRVHLILCLEKKQICQFPYK